MPYTDSKSQRLRLGPESIIQFLLVGINGYIDFVNHDVVPRIIAPFENSL